MKTLTVFTPAYNRAHTIGRTYKSLCRQTLQDFEWLVVDDGSSDNTKELVEGWIKENRIPIRYIYQENQGMHGAHNTAYKNIYTELNTCIDSDDYMPDDAVEKIINFWGGLPCEKRRQYAGIVGLDIFANGSVIGREFPAMLTETTLSGYYDKGGKGDKKLVYRTDVINQYPEYPLFEGEHYVGLSYKYLLIDRDFKLLTINEPLVVVEYQPTGSTMNMLRQYWNNPNGFAFLRKTEMCTTGSLKRKIIVCSHYVSSCLIAGKAHYFKESPLPVITILMFPMGWLLYRYIKYKNTIPQI